MWPFTDFVLSMLCLAVVLLGGWQIGSRWMQWSARRKRTSKYIGGLDVCDRLERVMKQKSHTRVRGQWSRDQQATAMERQR